MDKSIPGKLGKYEIVRELGRGSTGVVYLGFDPYINRPVAIKMALSQLPQNKEEESRLRKLFFNEARVAGMLDHPYILPIYDADVDKNQFYLVMEYIDDGGTLVKYCKIQNLLSIKKVLEIVFNCCKALDYAHRRGVIHRDIKPSNIMVTKDMNIKIGDFGIAQIVKTEITQLTGFVGSPRYMSPEQTKEEELTNHTDIFSLGVVMYELLTGKPPFQGENLSSLIYKIIYEEPLPLRHYRSDIPQPIEAIVKKALKKKINERYPMGSDFAADLRKALKNLECKEDKVDENKKFVLLKKLKFFKDFFDSEIWEVLRASIWREYSVNQEIITEGDIDDSFYIIVSGSVIVKKEEKPLVTLKCGDCFGEMGYISKKKRSASIFSKTEVILLQINGTLIDQASQGCQFRFVKVFLKTLIERLSRISKIMSHVEPQ